MIKPESATFYNVTALLDWSRCQTVPLESFMKIPEKLVPKADQFLSGYQLPDDLRLEWKRRKKKILGHFATFPVAAVWNTKHCERGWIATLICRELLGHIWSTRSRPFTTKERVRNVLQCLYEIGPTQDLKFYTYGYIDIHRLNNDSQKIEVKPLDKSQNPGKKWTSLYRNLSYLSLLKSFLPQKYMPMV